MIESSLLSEESKITEIMFRILIKLKWSLIRNENHYVSHELA